ncbi:tRNA (adenosine(37)-N6)-threonylcarbamoyltransferase complex ATPase subunit type 1 TsaE [Mycoplasma putrefaciens]|uniref:tRNA threonylcarbamoyladenosine biosynthesis protein TsaE n=1 Tax=Mycoplasma putrefaciens (strain ATCC 15718 / NCTC 10155 / C30 KS-1 / KS-1) TaxID=743965 RepID=A0A7U4E9I2_MYCPK|nr:tRNA (adenosine(37)-N6)-threonylcarbamoyltransferase complex ATPase subunit type 1 TsaE [Mycoplasma putrefaciens]AEM68944.1 ATPase, YjeE family protein [Mycoplasma putrefaciens KS1]
MKEIYINNLQDTNNLATKIAKQIKNSQLPFYLLLNGGLGSGKTAFTKSLLKELGVKENISSPTFVILNQYQTNDFKINHVDAYRLNNDSEIDMYLDEFDNSINIIEWYENLSLDFSNTNKITITIKIIDENKRIFILGE